LHRADDRKASGLVARVDVRDVGDAVAAHIVVVESAAELLAGEDLDLDRPVRRLLDRVGPGERRGVHGMARRNPVRETKLDRLVLRPPRPPRAPRPGEAAARASGTAPRGHGVPPARGWL